MELPLLGVGVDGEPDLLAGLANVELALDGLDTDCGNSLGERLLLRLDDLDEFGLVDVLPDFDEPLLPRSNCFLPLPLLLLMLLLLDCLNSEGDGVEEDLGDFSLCDDVTLLTDWCLAVIVTAGDDGGFKYRGGPGR